MKKILISTIAILLLISTNLFAQGKSDKDVAKKLCDCIDKSFAQYPPILREMITDMGEVGEEQAQKNFQAKMLKMTPKEQEKVAKAMEVEPEEALEKNCGESGKLIKEKNASVQSVLAQMKKIKNCKLGYSLLKAASEKNK